MEYPFTKCLRPRKVWNKYSNSSLIVGCGKCAACINSKSSSMTLQTSLESQKHRFTYFVTLTYSPEHLPTFSVEYDHYNRGYRYINHCARVAPLGELCVNIGLNYTKEKIEDLQAKCCLGGKFSYCNVRDVQLFLKRLRKHLTLQNVQEKIRYYVCAEYGPQHFRAHYHLLLWFSEPDTLNAMPQVIRKAWSLGRVDYSLSRGGCASYCSSYVNSFSHLPEIFKTPETKPFSRHSKFLAQELDEGEYERIYELSASEIIGTCVTLGDRMLPLHLSRSFKGRFFPRCREYAYKSFGELYRTYTLFDSAKYYYSQFKSEDKVDDIAFQIWLDRKSPFNWLFTPGYTYETLLRDLSFSKRFLEKNCLFHSPRYVLQKIVEFYKLLDYENLKNQYESQSALMSETNCDLELINNYYYATFNFKYLKDKEIYRSFYSDTQIKSERKIKHKRINDLNKIHF